MHSACTWLPCRACTQHAHTRAQMCKHVCKWLARTFWQSENSSTLWCPWLLHTCSCNRHLCTMSVLSGHTPICHPAHSISQSSEWPCTQSCAQRRAESSSAMPLIFPCARRRRASVMLTCSTTGCASCWQRRVQNCTAPRACYALKTARTSEMVLHMLVVSFPVPQTSHLSQNLAW